MLTALPTIAELSVTASALLDKPLPILALVALVWPTIALLTFGFPRSVLIVLLVALLALLVSTLRTLRKSIPRKPGSNLKFPRRWLSSPSSGNHSWMSRRKRFASLLNKKETLRPFEQ
jgi:hypothetical protein